MNHQMIIRARLPELEPAGQLLGISANPHFADMAAGRYEHHWVNLLRRVLKPGDIFIDVGANIGYFSVIASGLVGPAGHVFAFEPDSRYYSGLKLAAAAIGVKNMTLSRTALGAKNSRKKIWQTKDWGMSSLVPDLRIRKQVERTATVGVKRLDDYLTSRKINRAAAIKIDTEGYEIEVVTGLGSWLGTAAGKPVLLVEYFPAALKKLGHNPDELYQCLARWGYRVNNNLDVKKLPAGADDTYNLIFIPPGRKDFRFI